MSTREKGVVLSSMVNRSTTRESPTGSAKALVKGIAIVDLLASKGGGLRLTDLVNRIDLPRGTVVRLLGVLVDARLISPSSDGLYRLGPRCASWGSEFLGSFELQKLAADVMDALVELSNETCHLGVLDGRSVLYIHKVESQHSLRMVSRVGGRNPLHCTGVGKALLAFMPQDEQERYLAEPLERLTVNTTVDRNALISELQDTRCRGYALDDGESEVGVRCIGVPIFNHLGELAGSLSLSGPTTRMTWERTEQLVSSVKEAAQQISVRLGFGLTNLERRKSGTTQRTRRNG